MEGIVKTHSWESSTWTKLSEHASATSELHLRDLLKDETRSNSLVIEAEGITLDYSRQRVTGETMQLLHELAQTAKLPEKIRAMQSGARINITENRAVLHTALRAQKDEVVQVDGKGENVVPAVHEVLGRIQAFSDAVRTGQHLGSTGKKLTQVVAIGIGGSYLGPEFVHEALRTDPAARAAAEGRTLHFLANVDPTDVTRALEGFNPETTLVIVISKTFTTAETMMNAATVKDWLTTSITKSNPDVDVATIAAQHIVAGSANVAGAQAFGIKAANVFGFWDWVGGRYSVCSAVGVVPLSLQYGFPIVRQFLDGANSMDRHFFSAPAEKNLPIILGLIGVWNSTFLGHSSRALLPYSQALVRFAAHIQQVDMESNGKRIAMDGSVVPFPTGEVNFGEPGTNGQHSFYQLIHQGTVVPCDFIGFCQSQNPIELEGQMVSNHDELMSNFFAQPDALAVGKSLQQVLDEGTSASIAPHKVFPGNRPSSSILFDGSLDASAIGKLLALYEHRTVVQGFVWGICSFDQWGVELGKVLAKQVRGALAGARKEQAAVDGFNPSTTRLLQKYLASSL